MTKKIELKDISVKDIVISMAKSLGVTYDEEYNELCLRIPESMGHGYVKATHFDHGIGVLEADYLLHKDLNFELEKGIMNPLKIIFNREDAFIHSFTDNEDKREINHLESAIISSTSKHNHVFNIPAKTPVCIFSLEINRKLFEEKIEDFLAEMDENLETLFRDVNGVNLFFYKSFYSLNISKYMEEFTSCELEGFMRSVYLEAKAYEILVNHLKQYRDDLNEPNKRTILRQATVESIEKAVNIIEEELATVDNVLTLAKQVGLNQNTLQLGFQKLYKTSVNEYIRTHKIEKAKELIETSDLNITEITYKVGINSRSYFSKLFKERYGITPKQYRTKSTASKSEPDSQSA